MSVDLYLFHYLLNILFACTVDNSQKSISVLALIRVLGGHFTNYITGEVFEEWNEITPQIHIRKELIRLALTL